MTDESISIGASEVAHGLAGYLCGTHSGLHARGRRRSLGAASVLDRFRRLSLPQDGGGREIVFGDRWKPDGSRERRLRDSLAHCLSVDSVIDLVVFGSLARGSTTGYSDVDAILVVTDDALTDVRRLRGLRRHVLSAGRAVLAYQPLQHHGFLAVTPRLLRDASAALGLPAEALETTRSLFGRPVEATMHHEITRGPERLHALTQPLVRMTSWPEHPWQLHRTVAMFELAPTLYLQARGYACAKHQSFDIARRHFPERWGPYDVLDEVRRRWPPNSRPVLRHAATVFRNPWTAVALWRHVPATAPRSVAPLLDETCLRGLQRVIDLMARTL